MKNKRLIIILLAVPALLLIPIIAMRFTNEVNWTDFDFIVMGILLLVTGLTIEFVLRTIKSSAFRTILCLSILLAFILVWVELAVGVFGTPVAGS